MELNSLHREFFMPQAHNQSVIRLGGDFQGIRNGLRIYHQGVIPNGLEGVGQPNEHTCPLVAHHGWLTVTKLACPPHFGSVHIPYALVTQAHTQDRNYRSEAAYHVIGDSCLQGSRSVSYTHLTLPTKA